jgi:hypothetical protein
MISQIALISIDHYAWCKSFLYLGPGMGGGVLSLIIAFIVSLFTFIIAIIWYPIRKAIDFFKKLSAQLSSKNKK